ncbi:hypothetical protein [Enterovibrio calviensis]|uniref:hypothetical protein n=1 Tax=Enterovibrio calviensis TaxID=91359 RepID=UPI0004841018|nr:hypothetical protein [Enterovibrio calviensis]
MNRFDDVNICSAFQLTTTTNPLPLPTVEWQAINQDAPVPLTMAAGELPNADFILVTWTSAEWSALDHVMLNSTEPRYAEDTDWRKSWYSYADNQEIEPYSEEPDTDPIFYFQLVGITNESGQQQRVLLVKSQVHLAHPPWISGLEAFIDILLKNVGAKYILSTGTAGGGAITDMLGAAIVTNKAHILLAKPENENCSYNHQTFTCNRWFPSESLYRVTQDALMFPMNKVWNNTTIAEAIDELNQSTQNEQTSASADTTATSTITTSSSSTSSNATTAKDTKPYTYDDLINAPLNPENLQQAQIKVSKDQALLTTDFYFIEGKEPSKPYCFLEMDDAVIAHQAEQAGINYAFIRNVSDPIVVTQTASGQPISDAVRGNWSGIIYKRCGFYSSFNSVMMSWAAIAGQQSDQPY